RIAPAERAARLAALQAEVHTLLAPTALAQAPVFAVSAHSGEGVDALRAHLLACAQAHHAQPRANTAQGFRLAVDRSFTLAGVGTVVTGMVASGCVAVGDALHTAPTGRSVRVRGIHVHNRVADVAQAGERCALALAGVAKDEVQRGDWVCAPAVALSSLRLDVWCQHGGGEERPLRSGQRVHVHLGSADVLGTLVLLQGGELAPGAGALAQLVLQQPVAAWHGSRGVLRDASAQRTLAGVQVLDPFAPQRWRSSAARLQQLAALQLPDPGARLAALLAASPLGLELAPTARAEALPLDALPLPAQALHLAGASAAIAPVAFAALQAHTLDCLGQFHQQHPGDIGPDSRRLRRLAAPRASDALWQALTEALLAQATLARTGPWLHLPAHGAELSAQEETLALRLLPLLAAGAFDPPWVRSLAQDLGTPELAVRQTLVGLARRGEIFAVVKDLYYSRLALQQLADLARACAAAPGGLHAAAFRDASGLGRKRAIQVLEFFDRVGLTRRVRDQHLLRPDTVLF
ncbi:MAG: SelB C-terminal domain-containing protein, partial [Comamonadaceae bacterium]|nr:SelB C-terminal domain-containing protein [Comamonadaceae bacterium]